MEKILRIVITGGPCAGKTTALKEIQKLLEENDYEVIISDETATHLITANLIPDKNIDLLAFQKLILDMQLAKENALLEAANNIITGKKVAIIYDRGILDNRAYIPHNIFKKFIDDISLSEEEILDRYDLIIHMVSPAKDKKEVYTKGNKVRLESLEEAIEVEERTVMAWPNKNKYIIDNQGTFEDKIKRVKNIIKNYITQFEEEQKHKKRERIYQ